ncbi:MAG: hypothetical protein ACXVC7_01725 [Bacteroidia bacterium]
MKNTKLISIIIVTIVIAACKSSKKSTTSTVVSASATTSTNPPSSSNYIVARSPDEIYAPGNEELIAIQAQYKDVTLDKLKQGHTIYTFGACTRCHRAQSIYKYDETRWKEIIDNMAIKGGIPDEEKDAVYKYVLSIKATQPK